MVGTKQMFEAVKFVGLRNELRDKVLLLAIEGDSKSQGMGCDRWRFQILGQGEMKE